MSDLSAIRNEIKDMKPHIEKKDVKQRIIKEVVPTSMEAKQRAEKARKSAHNLTAEIKRNVSMEIKNKLSESFDFIEESCGSGSPEFEFYDEPKMVSEGLADGCSQYPIIGRASGVFAPIGVMSRNNRIYDNDHYDYLLDNQHLVDRITCRGMLGTIGHHDKKVDDQDLAEGKVSHIVTNLKIVEEADGSRNLYGTLEILDTPAGHLLKTYYDSGVPLFVSSRGGGNLLPVPNESYKRVDKTKYFLETFDIVKNPGFLQAKPVYEKVSESAEEVQPTVEEIVESVEEAQPDKIDTLIEAFTKLANSFMEAQEKKAGLDKQEEDEKKETKETKEAKEAKEAKEVAVVEAKKDKEEDEEDKPEDEKKDEEESAVASSVTEELPAKYQKMVDKVMDPHAGMTKADIANGYEQTKLISKDQAVANAEAQKKADDELKAMRDKLKAGAKKVNQKNQIATQLKLGLKEAKEAEAVKAQGVGEIAKNAGKLDKHIEEPQTLDRQELARTLKAQAKNKLK